MTNSSYNRPLHYLAIATTLATFPLIFMGGLVTSHGAGMSVPDWPNTYGYNMFLFPPRLWIGGILYEHTHRLMGTVVGMLSIALTIVAWRTDSQRWIQWLCTAVLGAVIFQGVLGGLRVVLVKLDLAIVHACIAQAFFCLAAFTALCTSRWWNSALPLRPREGWDEGEKQTAQPAIRPHPTLSQRERGKGLIAACVFAVVAIYLQLMVGAIMRHYSAGLAVPDFPLAYGKLLPSTDAASLAQINQQRAWQLNLPTVTVTQIWLHMGHRLGASIVSLAILIASGMVIARHRARKILLVPAILLLVLLVTQITLGAYTVWMRKPADIASFHVAVGAMTLLTSFIMCTAAIHLFATPRAARFSVRERFPEPAHGGLVTT